MITSTIRHGDLCVEFLETGDVRIIRQSTAQTIELSITEWALMQKLAEIQGWPVAPPKTIRDISTLDTGS